MSISGNDAINIAEKNRRDQEAFNLTNQEAEKKRAMLQKYIYENSNPNPVIVVICAVVIVAVVYLVYLAYIKPCASGKWYEERTRRVWHVDHNKLTDALDISIAPSVATQNLNAGPNIVSQHIPYLHDKLNLWNKPDPDLTGPIRVGNAFFSGNVMLADGQIGVWDRSNIIQFSDGNVLQKVRNVA